MLDPFVPICLDWHRGYILVRRETRHAWKSLLLGRKGPVPLRKYLHHDDHSFYAPDGLLEGTVVYKTALCLHHVRS